MNCLNLKRIFSNVRLHFLIPLNIEASNSRTSWKWQIFCQKFWTNFNIQPFKTLIAFLQDPVCTVKKSSPIVYPLMVLHCMISKGFNWTPCFDRIVSDWICLTGSSNCYMEWQHIELFILKNSWAAELFNLASCLLKIMFPTRCFIIFLIKCYKFLYDFYQGRHFSSRFIRIWIMVMLNWL